MPHHLPRRDRVPRILMRKQGNSSAVRLPPRATGKIPTLLFHVVSSWHPIERLCHEVPNSVWIGYLTHRDERTETVHRDRPLIFDSIAELDVLLFSFLKQVGSRGHTNSHDRPHFFFA